MKMLLPVLLMLATGKTILPGEVKVKTYLLNPVKFWIIYPGILL